MIGRVHILPPTAPHPPSVPWEGFARGFLDSKWCNALLAPVDIEDSEQRAAFIAFLSDLSLASTVRVGVFCTRPPHPEGEVHVNHFHANFGPDITHLVMWGGE